MNSINGVFSLTVKGRPIGKARPRVTTTKSGKSHTYTPQATRNWEEYIALLAREQTQNDVPFPTGNVSVTLMFYCTNGAADLDNLAKAVLDALNGIAWTDDTQVNTLHLYKHYEKPHRVEILIRKGQVDANTNAATR